MSTNTTQTLVEGAQYTQPTLSQFEQHMAEVVQEPAVVELLKEVYGEEIYNRHPNERLGVTRRLPAKENKFDRTSEYVFDIPLPSDRFVIRIYSTIQADARSEREEFARGCGQDAIRTVVYDTERDAVMGGEPKTLRIAPTESNPEGWKANHREKVTKLAERWGYFDRKCPYDGEQMVVMDGKYGKFFACPRDMEECDYTEDYNY